MLLQTLVSSFLLFRAATSISYNDAICMKTWYFDSPRPAPIRCPRDSFLFYHQCCGEFFDTCCWRFRPEVLYTSLSILLVLLLFCCCCCFAWLFVRFRDRKTRNPPSTPPTTLKEQQVQTVEAPPPETRRGSYSAATATDRELDYRYF